MRAARYARYLPVLLVASLCQPLQAQARKAKSRSPAGPSKQTTSEMNRMLGKFKWGMSHDQVIGLLAAEIRGEFKKKMQQEKEPYRQDQLRHEMDEQLAKLKADYVRFEGKTTSWDVSLVDREFAHKNDESMVVRWGSRDRRFYFFHHDKLWKMYVAFNADLFRDKTFEDFAAVMERRFGAAERKYKVNLKGDAEMSHLEWPPSHGTTLLAIDNTEFYGNFCLVLIKQDAAKKVREGRKVNSPSKRYSDPLVEAVTQKNAGPSRAPADSSDRGAGQRAHAPGKSDGPSSGDDTPAAARRMTPWRGWICSHRDDL